MASSFDQFTKVLALYEDGADSTKKMLNLGFNSNGDCDFFVQNESGNASSSTSETPINVGGDLTIMCAYNGAQVKSSMSLGDSINLAKTERTAESDRAIAKEALIDSDLATEQSARISGDGNLQSSLDDEVLLARAAELANATSIATETTARVTADAQHGADITANDNRARTAENVLTNGLSAEQIRAQNAEAANASLVATEESRALAAENINTVAHNTYVLSNDAVLVQDRSDRAADIAASEVSTAATQYGLRLAQKNAIETLITIEQTARIDGDAALGVRIDNLLNNLDPSALDSLTEIITAYTAADSSLSQLASDNLAVFTNWVDDSNFDTGDSFTVQANAIRSRLDAIEAFAANLQSS